jgi:hypothetical protein
MMAHPCPKEVLWVTIIPQNTIFKTVLIKVARVAWGRIHNALFSS